MPAGERLRRWPLERTAGPALMTDHPAFTRPLPADTTLSGFFSALGCFSIWGLFPVYFKALSQVPALEVLAHRVLWSIVVLLGLILVQGRLHALFAEFRNRRRIGFYLLTTLLISANWLLYIWAVQQGRILEASLGYYINPLVNVMLGVLFLDECLHPRQLSAVLIATFGVLVLVIGYGVFPWISLALALSFGGYGLLRKKAGYDATLGLAVETALLAPLAALLLLTLALSGAGALGMVNRHTDLLLLSAGLVTVVPLLMFLEAGRRLRLSTVGLIQYLTPTLQFLLAVVVYHEPFTSSHLLTFGCIWLALALYSADVYSRHRQRIRPA
ncbi:MAG: EamA family transporter RarD [Candidatus Competibacteraceae bacterium]